MGHHRYFPRCFAALQTSSPLARGTTTECAQGRHGWGEKPSLTQISGRNGHFPHGTDVSLAMWVCPQDAEAAEALLMARGTVPCLFMLLFPPGQKRPKRVRKGKAELHQQIGPGKSFSPKLPARW